MAKDLKDHSSMSQEDSIILRTLIVIFSLFFIYVFLVESTDLKPISETFLSKGNQSQSLVDFKAEFFSLCEKMFQSEILISRI